MLAARLGRPLADVSLAGNRALVLIVAGAIGLRVASALYQGNAVVDLPGVYDQISYDELARRVVEGHGFTFATGHWPATRAGEPTAHWSYLYTLYLAAVYAVAGFQPLIARLVQAVAVGLLHPWLAWQLGRRLGGQRVGLLAALFSAAYVYFFYYAGALVTESFYILAVLWTLDVSLRLADDQPTTARAPHTRRSPAHLWLELGLAIGLAALLRQVFLLFVPFLCLWLWWRARAREAGEPAAARRRPVATWLTPKGAAIAAAVMALVVAPWTVRNYQSFGTFVLLNTNAGYAFFFANHPIYGNNYVPLLGSGDRSYYDLIPKELLPLNEAELDRALLARGACFVVDDPARFAALSLGRAREYFKFWPSPESSLLSNVSRVGSFALALPFMLYGVCLALWRCRRSEASKQRAAVALLLLFVAVYTGVHVLSWALIRYRLPVDAVLLLFAAYGAADLRLRLRGAASRLSTPSRAAVARPGPQAQS